MTANDIIATLHWLNLLKIKQDGQYAIQVSQSMLRDFFRKIKQKNNPQVDPSCLRWTPPLELDSTTSNPFVDSSSSSS